MSLTPTIINRMINQALAEDRAYDDITTDSLVSHNDLSKGIIISKEEGVICGIAIAKKVFQKFDRDIRFKTKIKDGQKVKKNTPILFIKGKTKALLKGERTALNFLGHLSGIATHTHAFVQKIKPYKSKILDTRKTTPGLRPFEKYAVRCGGGSNHRFHMAEMIMIKDNHRNTSKLSLGETVARCRKRTKKLIQVEVDTLAQFKEASESCPDYILLDNMNTKQLSTAVKLNKSVRKKQRPLLEASGGINLKNVRPIAKTGVDRISVGSLTHSFKVLDFSLELTCLMALLGILLFTPHQALAQIETTSTSQETEELKEVVSYTIFDDKKLIEGYAVRYQELPKEILLEMIKDDTLTSYKSTAAVRVFKDNFGAEVVSKEKKRVEKILLRRLNRTDSVFVQVEIMDTLCRMDRYRYFKSMVPALIQKLDHYNTTINEMAFNSLDNLIKTGNDRAREARIVFHTLRKILFLSRKRIENVTEPDTKLSQKLKLVRWSIKVLGTEELKRLPKEVLNIL